MSVLVGFLTCLVGVLVLASPDDDESKMIYGEDNRKDFYQSSLHDQKIMRNHTVAFIKSYNLGFPNSYGIYHDHETASSLFSKGICSSERFAFQPTAAFCSGTLIGVDRVLTAGHCVTDCDDSFKMVFDYSVTGVFNAFGQIYGEDDVYTCRRLFRRQEEVGWAKYDYAIVQLDRPVRGRTPATVVPFFGSMLFDRVERLTRLSMYGYPSGLPVKSDHGGVVVRDNSYSSGVLDYFEGTTDSFGGNSGSGIYNDQGKVIGILVRGKTDYVMSLRGCMVVNVQQCSRPKCAELTNGEGISYAVTAVKAAPSCITDSDCAGSLTGSYCSRACARGEKCCTGWCVRFSFHAEPINYDPSECEEYLNKALEDVFEPSKSSTASASITSSISITPSITPTISTTRSLTPTISITPSITPSPWLYSPDDYDNNDNTELWTYIGVAVGVVVVVVAAVVIIRKRMQRPKLTRFRESLLENFPKPSIANSELTQPRIMAVTIPPGTLPGTRLQVVTPQGSVMLFDVPENAIPGQPIHVQY